MIFFLMLVNCFSERFKYLLEQLFCIFTRTTQWLSYEGNLLLFNFKFFNHDLFSMY
jgi:hypothetical protein